jgi:phospholipase/carboxylesterase
MDNGTNILQTGQWVIRVREPGGDGPHLVLLLLHGWTGDENSMWIFAGRLPKNYLLIAPRGLHASPLGGYSWHLHKEKRWPSVEDLSPAVDALQELLTPEHFPRGDFSTLRLAGFSQGAALVYTFSLQRPERVIALAGLSGFMPEGAALLAAGQPLRGKRAFVAHGTLDERVPVERARRAVEILEQAEAQVTYCEDEVGHKLSAPCFRGLEAFFADQR